MTTTRDLIQRLTEKLDLLHSLYDVPDQSGLVEEALDFLSKPVPEGPTDEEIADEARKYLVNEYASPAEITYLLDSENFEYKPTIGCFRAVIAADRARCGRPTTTQENN